MSGPPKDIHPSQLWLKLQEQPRPSKVVDFPRRGPDGEPIGQLRIRILTQEEQMICAAAAEEVARKHLKDGKKEELGYERLYADAVCVEVLFRACRDVDDPERAAFPTPALLQKQLTTEECAKLFEHYLTVQVELGPLTVTMSDAEIEAWIDRLVEGGSAFPFDLLSSDVQKIVLLHMAYQLRTSDYMKDSGSAGMQLDDPSSNSSENPPPADE